MAHTYQHTLDEWATNGTKSAPSSTLKSTGFTGGMKPPASVFNYQWDKVAKAIAELQQYALTEDPSGGIWQQLAAVALSGSYNDLLNKPDFKAVATSGSYTDLINIPSYLTSYSDYWWRRRPTASGYSEARIKSIDDGYSNKTETHTSSTDNITHYYLSVYEYYVPNDGDSEDIYATLQYSNSISINQSTGAVTMNSPSTYTVTESDESNITSSSFYSRFQGKYVKGFIGCRDVLFYIPQGVRMRYESWQLGNENANASYYGYEFTKDSGDYQPFRVSVQQNSSIGAWETISSSDSSAYPKSGTSGGYQWVYMGQVVDAAIKNIPTWTTINITSANFTGTTAFVEVPASIAIVMVGGSAGTLAVIDTANAKAYGVKASNSNYDPTTGINGSSGISSGIAAAVGGIKLTSSSGGFSTTISYLPLA